MKLFRCQALRGSRNARCEAARLARLRTGLIGIPGYEGPALPIPDRALSLYHAIVGGPIARTFLAFSLNFFGVVEAWARVLAEHAKIGGTPAPSAIALPADPSRRKFMNSPQGSITLSLAD